MNNGIDIKEACAKRLLTPEDFQRQCNADGTVRYQTQATDRPAENGSIPFDPMLVAAVVGIFFVAAVVALLYARRLR